MIDDIRVAVKVTHEPIADRELLPDGTASSPRRINVYGKWNSSVRARSVRDGEFLVIEGSYNGFLQGHNVVGSMNLQALVAEVVSRVLSHFAIVPAPAEQRAIEDGRIKLERLDLVGFLKADHLGGAARIIKSLDVGLAGSRENRMVFPSETLVYHSHSRYWSLMAYDKAQQLQDEHPATWDQLDPRVQDIARNFLRLELRQFRPELERLGWVEVKDVTQAGMTEQFAKRLTRLLGDLRRPYPPLPLPANVARPSVTYLRALLLSLGYDFISGLPPAAQRREWRALMMQYGITRRNVMQLSAATHRTLSDLTERPAFPIRHGSPRALKQARLVVFT